MKYPWLLLAGLMSLILVITLVLPDKTTSAIASPDSSSNNSAKKDHLKVTSNKSITTRQASLESPMIPVIKMVPIEGGCFLMGGSSKETERDNDERQGKVCVANFSIASHEVTQKQWIEVMGNNPSYFQGQYRPVEQVSLSEVQSFITRLNQKTGDRYRLPTSAEWEYAARAGTATEYYTGDCISTDQANYNGNNDYAGCGSKTNIFRNSTLPVGSFKANTYGLYDMAGNVWEWTCSEDRQQFENSCMEEIKDWDKIIIHGGGWGSSPYSLRSTHRSWRNPDHLRDDLGFRLAR